MNRPDDADRNGGFDADVSDDLIDMLASEELAPPAPKPPPAPAAKRRHGSESEARAAKVAALVLGLEKLQQLSGETAERVADAVTRWGAREWRQLAVQSGVREPSAVSREMTLRLFRERARGAA